MLSRADIETALINADAAGDVAAATILATALKSGQFDDAPQAAPVPETFDPTEGMSTFEKVAAGAGKSLSDTWSGLKQAGAVIGNKVGLVSDETVAGIQADIDEAKRLDAPLMSTGAGMAGNMAGHIAIAAAPLGLLGKAANAARLAKSTGTGAKVARYALNPSTMGGATTSGAALSAVQPVATGESRGLNTAIGAAAGPVGLMAGRGIAATARGAKSLVDPFRKAGREQIVGRTLREFAGDADEAARAMAGARELVPGSVPTAGEVSKDAGIAQLQRSAASADPRTAAALAERQLDQNAARVGALRGIAGDDAALEGAIQARGKAANVALTKIKGANPEVDPHPVVRLIDRILNGEAGERPAVKSALLEVRDRFYDPYPVTERGKDAWSALNALAQNPPKGSAREIANFNVLTQARTVMDRVKKGAIDADAGLAQLKGLKTKNEAINNAIDEARALLKGTDWKYKGDFERLYGIRKSIDDQISAMRQSPAGNAGVRELMVVKKALDRQISRAAPEFRKYLKDYQAASRQIDQMKVGQKMMEKVTGSLPDVRDNPKMYAEAFGRALKGDTATVKAATGFKRNRGIGSIMTPQQMATLNGIRDDVARSVNARDLGRAVGSNTAQNLASRNIMRQTMGPLGLPDTWGEGVMARTLARPLDFAYKAAEPNLQEELARALLDPKHAAALMQSVDPKKLLAMGVSPQLLSQVAARASVALPVGFVASQRGK